MNRYTQNTTERRWCALLLTGHDEAGSIERAALRQAGVLRVRTVHSGCEALVILRNQLAGEACEIGGRFEQPINFVVCTETLRDMSGTTFLREFSALCRKQGWALPPILAVTGDKNQQTALLALGAGAVLVRPYAALKLGESLQLLAAGMDNPPNRKFTNNLSKVFGAPVPGANSAAAAVAPRKFEAITAQAVQGTQPAQAVQVAQPVSVLQARSGTEKTPHATREALNPLLYTRRGLALLRENRLDEAEALLHRALRHDSLDLEACLGLMRLCRQRDDPEGEERWSIRAAVICLNSGQTERAEMFLSRLPREIAADPFMAEARCLLQEEDYEGATEAFAALRVIRPEVPLHELAARASQFTDCPQETLLELCSAYKRIGQDFTARQLYNRLLARSEECLEPVPSGLFPALGEVVAVMKFAASAWRKAAI